MTNQKPVSIENLPEYLKSVRERGESGGAPVVGMGQIMVPKRSHLLRYALASLTLCFTLAIGGIVTYNYTNAPQNMTVVLGTDQKLDTQAVAALVTENGGEVIAVTQRDDMTYEVKLAPRQNRQSLLERLRNHKRIKKAE